MTDRRYLLNLRFIYIVVFWAKRLRLQLTVYDNLYPRTLVNQETRVYGHILSNKLQYTSIGYVYLLYDPKSL